MKVVRLSASSTGRPYLQEMFLVLIFTRGWVNPRTMVRSEGNMPLKNPVTPPGIDPGTVRLVVQCLNHYATIGPRWTGISSWKKKEKTYFDGWRHDVLLVYQWIIKHFCTSGLTALLRARLHVSTSIIGHLQAFSQLSLQILCMLGSHHVYTDENIKLCF